MLSEVRCGRPATITNTACGALKAKMSAIPPDIGSSHPLGSPDGRADACGHGAKLSRFGRCRRQRKCRPRRHHTRHPLPGETLMALTFTNTPVARGSTRRLLRRAQVPEPCCLLRSVMTTQVGSCIPLQAARASTSQEFTSRRMNRQEERSSLSTTR